MSGVIMEMQDYYNNARAEIAILQEDLQRVRLDNEAKERAQELLLVENIRLKREVSDLRKQVQAWADEADADIQLAKLRREELEALEL